MQLTVAVLAAMIVALFAGCGLDYDKLETKLVPGYTIEGNGGGVIVLDPGRVFHRAGETFARAGEDFYLEPIWLIDGEEVFLSTADEVRVSAVVVNDARILELTTRSPRIKLRGLQSGVATVYCSVSLTHRGITRHYRAQETVNIYCPLPEAAPLPEEHYQEPQPPPDMAAVF